MGFGGMIGDVVVCRSCSVRIRKMRVAVVIWFRIADLMVIGNRVFWFRMISYQVYMNVKVCLIVHDIWRKISL